MKGRDVDAVLREPVDDGSDFVCGENDVSHHRRRRAVSCERDPTPKGKSREELQVSNGDVQVTPRKAETDDASRLAQASASKRLLDGGPIARCSLGTLCLESGGRQRGNNHKRDFTHPYSPVRENFVTRPYLGFQANRANDTRWRASK